MRLELVRVVSHARCRVFVHNWFRFGTPALYAAAPACARRAAARTSISGNEGCHLRFINDVAVEVRMRAIRSWNILVNLLSTLAELGEAPRLRSIDR